jgi:hypothetical protein
MRTYPRTLTLTCDECLRTEDVKLTVIVGNEEAANAALESRGWFFIDGFGDVCAACKQNAEAAQEAAR